MRIVYETRGKMLPQQTPLYPGMGKIKAGEGEAVLNGGLPTGFDYGMMYCHDDLGVCAEKAFKSRVYETFSKNNIQTFGFGGVRSIAYGDTVKMIFIDVPTCRVDHVQRPIEKSILYFEFKKGELTSDLGKVFVYVLSSGDFSPLTQSLDAIFSQHDTLVEFRAKPSEQKNEWLCGQLLPKLSEWGDRVNTNGSLSHDLTDIVEGRSRREFIASGNGTWLSPWDTAEVPPKSSTERPTASSAESKSHVPFEVAPIDSFPQKHWRRIIVVGMITVAIVVTIVLYRRYGG